MTGESKVCSDLAEVVQDLIDWDEGAPNRLPLREIVEKMKRAIQAFKDGQ